MVLDYLQRQKEQPDSELLRELNWTQDDLNSFLQRWERARELANSPDPEKRRQWTEQLRSLGLTPPAARARAAEGRNDALRGLEDSGSRVRPPESLRKQFEAFRRAVGSPSN
jgi:collagen type III alpha